MKVSKIEGFKDYYIREDGEVENRGSKARKLLLSRNLCRGYPRVTLYRDGKPHTKLVHRLVAEAFLPRIKDRNFVNHKDGNKMNFSLKNLEWVTFKENLDHAKDTGLCKKESIKGIPEHVKRSLKWQMKYRSEGKSRKEIEELIGVSVEAQRRRENERYTDYIEEFSKDIKREMEAMERLKDIYSERELFNIFSW